MSIKRRIKRNRNLKFDESIDTIFVPFKVELVKKFYEFYISDYDEKNYELEYILYNLDGSYEIDDCSRLIILTLTKFKNDLEDIEESKKEGFNLPEIDVSITIDYCEGSSATGMVEDSFPESLSYYKFKKFLIKLLKKVSLSIDNKIFEFKIEA